jgi:hypothetical protein
MDMDTEFGFGSTIGGGSSPIVPSGVLFKTIEPSQYTSYRTGDEGWRVQNGYFDYVLPTNPKAIAELDFTVGANFWYKLKNPLVVNGVSSTTRFVDFNGIQVFDSLDNCDLYLIDKLTGFAYQRGSFAAITNWDNNIDQAIASSINIKGVTYDNIFVCSMNEYLSCFGLLAAGNWTDPITSNVIASLITSGQYQTSNTLPQVTTYVQAVNLGILPNNIGFSEKVSSRSRLQIFDVRNLITAP